MRQVLLVLFVACLLPGIALAQYGKPAENPPAAKPDFAITASYIEACSCDQFCPCYFNDHSTVHGDQHYCKANLVLRVDHGYYKETKLDGAKVWMAVNLGSDWSTGKDSWLILNYDPSVTPEQRTALNDILGQLYPFKWQKMETDTAAFTWKVDLKSGVAQAKMNNGKGEVILERVSGNDPKREVIVHNLKYWLAQSNTGFRMWKTKHEYYDGHGEKIDFNGTNGFLITISFSGQAKKPAAD